MLLQACRRPARHPASFRCTISTTSTMRTTSARWLRI